MKTSSNHERGTVMVLIVSILTAAMLVWVATSYQLTSDVGRKAARSRAWNNATAIGLGCTDLAFASWRTKCRNNGTYATSLATSSFVDIPVPQISSFTSIPNATITNYSVKAVDPQLTDIGSSTPPPAAYGQNSNQTSYYYIARADVSIPVIDSPAVKVSVQRVFEKQNTSPWNYAIFYSDDLELHPGPQFTVTGPVHTNGDLYTGHSNTTFASNVTYTGNWNIGFDPLENTHPETPASPYFPQDIPPASTTTQLPFGIDPTIFSSANANTVDKWRELIEMPVSGTDPLASYRYYNQAGVKILIDASNNVTVINGNGTTLSSSSTGTDKKLYDTFKSAVSTNGSIQDNREAASVRVVTLDVSQITTAKGNGTFTSSTYNGVVYIADTSGTSSTKRAIRLKNGASLPTGGLTIASNNAVYIQGDYNTGSTSTTKPASDNSPSDPTQPTVSGYTRQPAAVLADAVMVLSNAWSDSNSTKDISYRLATPTTVNTAIVAGIVPSGTSGTNYSGGAENYPRFLEDWGNDTLTYYGSMVQLWTSQQFTGIWGSANVYSPPVRQWYFDTNFQVNPPPGVLINTNYNKQRWFFQ